jgi:hypothetical protein
MVLLGVGAAVTGSGYKVGSLAKMGSGFMPVVLGVVLAFLGILIPAPPWDHRKPTTRSFCRTIRNGSAGSAFSAVRSFLSFSGSTPA